MKLPFALLLIASILVFSCSKDSFPDVNSHGTSIFQVRIANQLIQEFEFDEFDRLKTLKYISNDGTSTHAYTYPNDSMRISFMRDGEPTGSELYYPVEEDVFIWHRERLNGETGQFWEYDFSGSSCSFSEIRKYAPDSSLWQRIRLSYENSNCNMTASYYDTEEKLLKEEHYTYDGEESFSTAFILDFMGVSYLGNISKYTLTRANGTIDSLFSYTSSYIYNLDGFPVWEERRSLSGEEQVYEYTYY